MEAVCVGGTGKGKTSPKEEATKPGQPQRPINGVCPVFCVHSSAGPLPSVCSNALENIINWREASEESW